MKRISTPRRVLVFFIGCGSMDRGFGTRARVAQSASALTTKTTVSDSSSPFHPKRHDFGPPDEQASWSPHNGRRQTRLDDELPVRSLLGTLSTPGGGWGTWHYIGSQSNCGGAALDTVWRGLAAARRHVLLGQPVEPPKSIPCSSRWLRFVFRTR